MSTPIAFQRPSSLRVLPPVQAVGRHQLWLDDAHAVAPVAPLALRIDLSSLDRAPDSSIRGPLHASSTARAWPLAADEPPTLSVRRGALRLG